MFRANFLVAQPCLSFGFFGDLYICCRFPYFPSCIGVKYGRAKVSWANIAFSDSIILVGVGSVQAYLSNQTS